MTTLTELFKLNRYRRSSDEVYYVIHPLDDEPEEKRDPTTLGPMRLSRFEKVALYALQGYLLVMVGLAAYRVADLAGFLPHAFH